MRALATAHGPLRLPAFCPDATRAVIRTVEALAAAACGIEAVMVNVLHLSSHPGTSLVRAAGGIHPFMAWKGPVLSDSGGFQVLSLIQQSPELGSVSPRGFSYRLDRGHARKTLTPERCMQQQFRLGADIMFCLDHCTHPSHPAERQRESVAHTIAWARRCRQEFDRRLAQRGGEEGRPLLFAVVQGGSEPALRRECAEALLETGFDGYGYGGWPVGSDGALVEAVGQVAELTPPDAPRHALGVGKPESIVRCARMGYDLFDCTLPTRDARHARLYAFTGAPAHLSLEGSDFYEYVHMQDERHARDRRPVDEHCDCPCCLDYTRAYLHHLFVIRDALAHRLATLHNLRFYAQLMQRLQAERGAP